MSAEVAGVAHRLPVVRPVPLQVAVALIACGTPSVVRRAVPGGTADEAVDAWD